MSRIGNNPIAMPSGVSATLSGSTISVKGPKGSLSFEHRPEVGIEIAGDVITVTRGDDSRESRGFHGLTRSLIANMVTGVHTEFEKVLEIVGVGYKADVKGDTVNLALGFSHPVAYKLPKGISASVDKQTVITIKGVDKQLVGQVAADIRAYRKPEPYKGKGIKYSDEVIIRKAGKAGK